MVLSISCDTSSNSYSSKNTVNIDESKIKSIKIGGNFIAYLTIDGQVINIDKINITNLQFTCIIINI